MKKITPIFEEEDIDERTGLPRLDDEHYWWVGEISSSILTERVVELRRRRKWWIDKVIYSRLLDKSYDQGSLVIQGVKYSAYDIKDNLKLQILITARDICEIRKARRKAWERQNAFKLLKGSYPPRSLNA